MIAVDTNILVRFFVGDDLAQFERARALLETHVIFISTSVLLETEWVLRGGYGFDRNEIADRLSGLTTVDSIRFENEDAVLLAIEWHKSGLDFADAVHLASARPADRLATFDDTFIKRAGRLSNAVPVSVP